MIFKRLLKITLIISICFMNVVSYSAISVSDGSAFVSKAEFSADVNALSNRMAQLENALDSKIDSLVSTYLTKNGIWNAKKQTLTSYKRFTNTVTGANLCTMYKTGTTANLNNIVDGLTGTHYTLVNSLDKSGLVNVTYNTTGSAIAIAVTSNNFSGKKIDGSTFTGHTYFRDLVRYSGSVSFNLYVSGEQRYSQQLFQVQCRIDEDIKDNLYDVAIYMNWYPMAFNAYFFANKGQAISWNVIYSASYAEIVTSISSSMDLRGSAFALNISNVNVY